MTRIITFVPQINTQSITGENTQARVTVAGPKGWALQIDRDRSATTPRGKPIRADRPYDADPVVRQADKVRYRG